jgi:hypothetical protein
MATILAGSFGLSVRYCLRSKCEHFSMLCGLIKIDRRVDLETSVEMKQLELGVSDDEEKVLKTNSASQLELSEQKSS